MSRHRVSMQELGFAFKFQLKDSFFEPGLEEEIEEDGPRVIFEDRNCIAERGRASS